MKIETILSKIFHSRFTNFKKEHQEMLGADQTSEVFYFVDRVFTSCLPSLVPNKNTTMAIKVMLFGFEFFLVDKVTPTSFSGHKLLTHYQYILSDKEIDFLKGFLSAVSIIGKYHEI